MPKIPHTEPIPISQIPPYRTDTDTGFIPIFSICGLGVWVPLHREGTDRPGGQEERGVQLRVRGFGIRGGGQYELRSSTKIVT